VEPPSLGDNSKRTTFSLTVEKRELLSPLVVFKFLSYDGVDLEITMEDIALAVECPHRCPLDLVKRNSRHGIFPIGFTARNCGLYVWK
jgi:hypothetical protein